MRIACVHQGYELYGSDRCFAESVAAIRAAFPEADIEVVLPRRGPIVSLLEGKADRIVFEPLWALRRQSFLRLLSGGLFSLPAAVIRAAARMRRCDLVYVNTSVVADYLLAARFNRSKTLLHVHEIPEGVARTALRTLARWSGAEIIFNSHATREAFAPVGAANCHVVYNGVAGPVAREETTYDGSRSLRALMLGRINRIKGQEVLLAAVVALPPQTRDRLELRLVGGAFESEERERDLRARVRDLGLASIVSVEPFTPDTAPLYRWADIVVVPSRLPESLGRVAIEAMSFGRPTIASAIGGLKEVVEDGKTGWHASPGDADALAARLRLCIEDSSAWRHFGRAARARYEAFFSEPAAAAAIGEILRRKLARAPVDRLGAAAEAPTAASNA